jgi:polyphosphate kinase 2 (PPK2 family)
MIRSTNTPFAPWRLISGHDSRHSVHEIYRTLVDSIEKALEAKKTQDDDNAKNNASVITDKDSEYYASPVVNNIKIPFDGTPLIKMRKLKDVDLNKSIDEDTYRIRLAGIQSRLFSLHNTIYMKKIPLIIAYEGWDAAGKGGNIKRLTSALDPRGYEVIPISAPNASELSRPFLWRFWQTLPKDGHIAIYDRTWYGRVLVERIEGFAREEEWRRAYREINEFEAELVNWGAAVVKFWLHIDKNEQYRRFSARTVNPDKQWKITEEDWRNREKWDVYETAADDMLRLTSTTYAPWHIIESQNKRFARVKAIEILIDALQNALK